jgi:hypothetical protein
MKLHSQEKSTGDYIWELYTSNEDNDASVNLIIPI